MAITRTPQSIVMNSGNVTWTNMPAALTELFGLVHRRTRAVLVDADRCRIVTRVSTAGIAGAVLKAQYSTDESAWSDLTGTVAINAVGTVASAWGDIPAGAKGDVFLRVVGSGGDGVADPILGNVCIQVR